MVKNKGKRSLIIALSIAIVLVVAIIAVIVIRAIGAPSKDPYIQNTTNTPSSEQTTTTPDDDNAQDEPAAPETSTDTDEPAVDPASLTTVDIAPMSITVSYVKGVGGFEYEVLRAQNGTRYVQFSSLELAGTKCTNDTGVFASILASPTEAEGSTLAKKVTVDGTEYGLSLAGTTCATDTDKLKKYQESFTNGFSALKKMN